MLKTRSLGLLGGERERERDTQSVFVPANKLERDGHWSLLGPSVVR